MTTKPTNPKDAIGSNKLPLHLWPATATAMGTIGLLNGALKYGRSNWRAAGVRASIYVDACQRHLAAWFEGEEVDPDDGAPHLAAALACLAIIVDARAAGMLIDDRQLPGGYRQLVDELTPHVERLKALHAGRDPHQWTIADAPEKPSGEALGGIVTTMRDQVLCRHCGGDRYGTGSDGLCGACVRSGHGGGQPQNDNVAPVECCLVRGCKRPGNGPHACSTLGHCQG